MLTLATCPVEANVARVYIWPYGDRVTVSKPAYHHGNLRRALLDAALALFAARGTFDFTLRELAREAGVTHNAPYRHFASKGDLLAALRAEGFAALSAACEEALAAARPDPRSRVRALGEAYVRFALEHRHSFRLMLYDPLGAEPAPRAAGGAFALLERTIDEGRRAGAVRKDLSAREIALGAWSLVHGLASLAVEGQVPIDERRLARYVAVTDAPFFDGALA